MERFLQVDFVDGTRWEIPAHVIAQHAADYYASLESDESRDDTRRRYFDRLMSDGHESSLKGWAFTQMEWKDVKPFAVRVPKPPEMIDYDAAWIDNEVGTEIVTRNAGATELESGANVPEMAGAK